MTWLIVIQKHNFVFEKFGFLILKKKTKQNTAVGKSGWKDWCCTSAFSPSITGCTILMLIKSRLLFGPGDNAWLKSLKTGFEGAKSLLWCVCLPVFGGAVCHHVDINLFTLAGLHLTGTTAAHTLWYLMCFLEVPVSTFASSRRLWAVLLLLLLPASSCRPSHHIHIPNSYRHIKLDVYWHLCTQGKEMCTI